MNLNKTTEMAIITKSDRRIFYCKAIQSEEHLFSDDLISSTPVRATALGSVLKKAELVVGDKVVLETDNRGDKVIVETLERKNELYRYIIREQKKKVTAANIDYMVICVSCDRPSYKRGLVDRYLVRSMQWNITPIVIFNKYDMYKKDANFDLDFEIKRLEKIGVNVYVVSALYPQTSIYPLEQNSLQSFQKVIQNKMIIFLGPSGVGKSCLIECLADKNIKLKTHALGKSNKGVHTTTWSELIFYDHFILIDTPGIRSFSLEDLDPDNLMDCFPMLNQYTQSCQFSNCAHHENDQSCGIVQELNRLQNEDLEIFESFFKSYFQIKKELKSSY